MCAERELITPPLDGIILPGVTRQSLLDLARGWVSRTAAPPTGCSGSCEREKLTDFLFVPQGEFKVTERTMVMKELLEALDGGRVLEVFGAGTACVVCPVGSLLYQGQVSRPPEEVRL